MRRFSAAEISARESTTTRGIQSSFGVRTPGRRESGRRIRNDSKVRSNEAQIVVEPSASRRKAHLFRSWYNSRLKRLRAAYAACAINASRPARMTLAA